MEYADLFREDLIEIEAEYSSQQEMFETICNNLFENGFVAETFKDAITKREEEYPTGILTGKMSIAIPHTDVMHVHKPFIYVVKLKKTLPFIQMGTTDEWIEVENIFMLGIKVPSEQIGLLSLMMDKLQNEQFNNGYNMISSQKEMEKYLKNNFRSEEK
ncbi:PTS sugar transporter subunit IIA [Bacillus chungangensis]|uniref:PTS system galactitol-specific IIA component n=1 Tax=Bacillus chungangensis TaxID=587633 RepID=A0ABT9WNT8_9BACI|nr:PTS sugar transporter subunit IIA [Bacillus chungangensis]MDQ0174953.1 PTS system galactitol-specific IIA component [Bacillus chungangensis]